MYVFSYGFPDLAGGVGQIQCPAERDVCLGSGRVCAQTVQNSKCVWRNLKNQTPAHLRCPDITAMAPCYTPKNLFAERSIFSRITDLKIEHFRSAVRAEKSYYL